MDTLTCIKLRTNLDQAKHNEEVAGFLLSNETYSDWIVIIHFYAAMHYVMHLILPHSYRLVTGIECTCSSFENLFEQKKRDKEGRHGFLNRFVRENHSTIGVKYQKLHEMSVTARYNNAQYDKRYIDISKRHLKEVKDYCLKHKS